MRVIENKTHAKIKDTEHGPSKAKLEFIIIIIVIIIIIIIIIVVLVKLELKGGVQLKGRVKICI